MDVSSDSGEFSTLIKDNKPIIQMESILICDDVSNSHSKVTLAVGIPEITQYAPSSISSRSCVDEYLKERHKATIMKIAQMRKEKYEKETKECTYHPKVSIDYCKLSLIHI